MYLEPLSVCLWLGRRIYVRRDWYGLRLRVSLYEVARPSCTLNKTLPLQEALRVLFSRGSCQALIYLRWTNNKFRVEGFVFRVYKTA